MSDETCECGGFHEGDWVECKLNTDLIGIVIGDADYGRYINVQLAGTLEIRPFHAVTLRHAERETPPAKEETPPSAIIINIEDYLRRAKPAGRA